jgi:hypothetical protein
MENGHSAETGGRLQQHRREKLGSAQKKSRKQRIPGGRRTLAASGGDWSTELTDLQVMFDS